MANLYSGKTGDAVTELQNNLISLGYSGVTASGTYDAATKSAVTQFQKDQGLANPDGIYGVNSSAAMTKALANLNSTGTTAGTASAVTAGTDAASGTTTPATSTGTAASASSSVPNYSAQMNSLYEKIMSRGSFSYDPNTDDTYNAYKKLYESQGKQAMQDTIGQAAALTGGYGNTYGQTAGQQAYNSYLEKLNSLIPELREEAYNEWANEGDTLTTQYSLAQSNQEAAYEKYMNMIQNLGYMPTEDELAAAGISADEAQLWYDYYNKKSSGSGTTSNNSNLHSGDITTRTSTRATYSADEDSNGSLNVYNTYGQKIGTWSDKTAQIQLNNGSAYKEYDDSAKTWKIVYREDGE